MTPEEMTASWRRAAERTHQLRFLNEQVLGEALLRGMLLLLDEPPRPPYDGSNRRYWKQVEER